jgi:acyl-CoA synthetase (AMP-forming)/AMP-acid ligase II
VVLSHRNVLANVEAIRRGLALEPTDVGASWLPLFHDMGLVGTLLTPILVGCDCYLSAPEDFARDPLQWLRTISERRATLTVAPSTGYLHTLRRVPEPPADLDLSSLRAALNGAETVNLGVMRAFLDRFAGYGLRPTVFLPVYGLAEGTLAVSFPPLGRPARAAWVDRGRLGEGRVELRAEGAASARPLVSVGTAVHGAQIRLVQPDGAELAGEDVVGEIEIRGPSVMTAYEDDPVATAKVVRAGGWVATGDLGFRHGGELYIAGRRKEMVVVLGQNYYASDVEAIVSALPALAGGAVLAASAPYPDGEGLLLLVETRHRDEAVRAELAGQIRRAVAESIGISPQEIVFASRGRLPRTSSGKLLRRDVSGLRDQLTSQGRP